MTRELIVQAKPTFVELALLEDGRLVEFHQEKNNTKVSVGDIFLGKITKVTPGLNATFVNIGSRKEGFLHYSDLGPQLLSHQKFLLDAIGNKSSKAFLDDFELEEDIDKKGKINELLKRGIPILVQVTKEPISTKGPRLTSEITLPGRYCVLVPFSNQISVSRKIKDNKERKRLMAIFETSKPRNFGVIVRTAALDQQEEELERDINDLIGKWEVIRSTLQGVKPPMKMYSELNKSFSILRDLLTSSFSKVVVNDGAIATEIKDYLYRIAPEKQKIVEHYKGKKTVFDRYSVTKQMKVLFGKTVNLPNGAYIIIEHTEAMNVIDVNSGNKVSAEVNQEKNALAVNMIAAEEISRQLRLRDIGGIIIIDFIDMKKAENRKMVLQKMRDSMSLDRAKHTILAITKFGLMQITRQRVRPVISIETTETCPTCSGTGKIDSPLLLLDEIESDIDYLFDELNYKKLRLTVHPFVDAYMKKGWWNSLQWKWFYRYKKWVDVSSDSALHLTQYRFFFQSIVPMV